MSSKALGTSYDFYKDVNNLMTETQDLINTLKSLYNSFSFGPSILLNSGTAKSAYTTTSTRQVMSGLGITFTPASTGRVLIIGIVQVSNNTAADGVTANLKYGTGTAPAAGAAVTGTTVGETVSVVSETASQSVIGSIIGVATGLTVGTTYWLDVAVEAVTGGTASATLLGYVAIEF